MKKGFRKAISLESNQSRLTMEGALTAAAIGLMMMLVLHQQNTQASSGEEAQGNSRPNFDATRVPTGRIAVSQATLQDATRLRQASPYAPQDLGDIKISDQTSKRGSSDPRLPFGFGLNESRSPYGGFGSAAQGTSGTNGGENHSGGSGRNTENRNENRNLQLLKS